MRENVLTLSEIRKILSAEVVGRVSLRVPAAGISMHSQEIRPGWIFVAVSGTHQDGRMYVGDAVRRGAIAVIAEAPVQVPSHVPVLVVPDCRLAAARVASMMFGDPSRALRVIGITGTNGKTTTATLLKSVLVAHGEPTGMIGTIAYEIGDRTIAATRTTPDAVTLHHLLHDMVKSGCRAAVLEVSSHALAQQRTAYLDFDAAAFTNLTRDHLDYHKTMEAYFNAKAMLFRDLPAGRVAVIDADEEWGARLAGEPLVCEVVRTGLGKTADVKGELLDESLEGTRFMVLSPWGRHEVSVRLPGVHNVRNALTCFALACSQGVPPETVVAALGDVPRVRGRLQRIASSAPFSVFVDYAHTDDALRCVLQALQRHTTGRLLVVFGCGGGRDQEKRVLMGNAVYAHADVAYITSDNPRNEQPESIIAAVRAAFPAGAHVQIEVDRRLAIQLALSEAQAGDTVCIAGKGHEVYQEVEGRMLPFDDVLVAKEVLGALGYEE